MKFSRGTWMVGLVAVCHMSAASIALQFTGGSGGVVQNVMAGWRFQTVQSITVESLGVYTATGGGLLDSHQVGIWDSVGTLLTSATVPAGTAGTLVNGFWYTPTAPVVLPAGQLFTIAALYGQPADALITAFANETTDPAISYVDRATSLTGVFSVPINFNTLNLAGDFGPNFAFDAVPEPATWAFLGIGLAGMIVLRLRRRAANRLT